MPLPRLAVLLPLALVACTDPVAPPASSIWDASIASDAPRDEFMGQVGAVSQFGVTTVSLVLERGAAGREYGWHLIRGSCGQTQGSFGPRDRYPTLALNQTGRAEAVASVNEMLDPQGSYALVVDTEDGLRRLACAVLARR